MHIKQAAGKGYEFLSSLPPWAKGIIGVGGGLILFFAVKGIINRIKDDANPNVVDDAKDEIKKWTKQGMKPSYSDAQYKAMGNQIYEGMRYALGDDYGTVEAKLKDMKNNLDVAMLIVAFGLKQDYVFGINEGDPKDLFTFVRSELGSEYLGATSYRVKNINADWAKKNITYKI